MKTYRYNDEPIRIYGLPEFERSGRLARLSDELIEKIPTLSHYGRRCPGGRMELQTDARSITVRVEFKTLSVDVGMSLYNCQSAFVTVGTVTEMLSICSFLGSQTVTFCISPLKAKVFSTTFSE